MTDPFFAILNHVQNLLPEKNSVISAPGIIAVAVVVAEGTLDPSAVAEISKMTTGCEGTKEEQRAVLKNALQCFKENLGGVLSNSTIVVAPAAEDEYMREMATIIPNMIFFDKFNKEEINETVTKNTGGAITSAWDGELPEDANVNLVVSAVDFFKRRWLRKPKMVEAAFPFTRFDGTKNLLPAYLEFASPAFILQEENFQGAAVEFETDMSSETGMSKIVGLFVKPTGYSHRLGDMCQNILRNKRITWPNDTRVLRVPPFHFKYKLDLLELLVQTEKPVPMQNVAPLSELAVLQSAASVLCNEEGAEAAACTTAVAVTRGISVTKNITMDSPFYFVIGKIDPKTNMFTPVSVSMVAEPKSPSSSVGRARGF